MEIREFAETILFSPSLDDKLRPPGELTDNAPGSGKPVPDAPERPAGLRFASRQSRFRFPSLHELESDPVRGRLLHFFANHELLATELMALALLKFPTAPKTFRAGLLRTLLDEQLHTRMYLGRLRQLGVEFGEFPVNGFFWRVISDMPTPLDYVSRLSLTFEQANLDFSRLFAERFKIIGDSPSEKLMDRIYQDEINHVGFGLEWFRQWKDPAQTDWEAFQSVLSLPLSPSRAKAEPFNRDGRLAAGLEPEFIEQLHVYSRSKGRPPHIHVFNPFAEAIIGQGAGFSPNAKQAVLARDLEILPAYLCRQDDVVLLHELPDTAFLSRLKCAGFKPPEFELVRDGRIPPDSELRSRKIGGFRPWAWSPDSVALLKPLLAQCSEPPPFQTGDWTDRIRDLYSKASGTELLRELLATANEPETLCLESHVGMVARSLAEATSQIEKCRSAGHDKLVAKMLHGVAGSNMQRLWEPQLTAAQETWIERGIATSGGVMIEPWLDRVLDFSFQFDFDGTHVRLIGTPRMINDQRGQYQASECHPRFTSGMDPEIAMLVCGPRGGRLKRLHAALGALLQPRLAVTGFRGALGIDALVYRDRDRLRIKPVVEINPRYTMGRLMLELMRHAANGSAGRFELITPRALQLTGFKSFPEYADDLQKRFPLQLQAGPLKRIVSGAVCLNDPARVTGCLAVFTLRKT